MVLNYNLKKLSRIIIKFWIIINYRIIKIKLITIIILIIIIIIITKIVIIILIIARKKYLIEWKWNVTSYYQFFI